MFIMLDNTTLPRLALSRVFWRDFRIALDYPFFEPEGFRLFKNAEHWNKYRAKASGEALVLCQAAFRHRQSPLLTVPVAKPQTDHGT